MSHCTGTPALPFRLGWGFPFGAAIIPAIAATRHSHRRCVFEVRPQARRQWASTGVAHAGGMRLRVSQFIPGNRKAVHS
jgi:hypothetical protein